MKKILLLTLPTLSLLVLIVPSDWLLIYQSVLSSSAERSRMAFPIRGIQIDQIEDTFGAARSGGRSHEGVDLFSMRGTMVHSVCEGVVTYAGRDGLGGNVVKIVGRDRRLYYYAHLSSIFDLRPGRIIRAGEPIGLVGNTGNAVSTPPHLHFEIMEITWPFPLITKNVNPYHELKSAKGD
jgi:murein DD-endopeptidase MepM/ murein hydrolase activator NlpD